MLVLSRTSNESIAFYLGGEKIVEITVNQILANKVKLGVTGNMDVVIARSELSPEIVSAMIQKTQVKKDAVK